MFTGLVEDTGRVSGLERGDEGARLTVSTSLAADLAAGDSIAVSGVCLTATGTENGAFRSDVMRETLGLSTLAQLAPGDAVNLELPLRADERLGGHFVQGHVDGTGTVESLEDDGFARRLGIAPQVAGLLRYVVAKGSIAVDGVSLTVAGADEQAFTVSLIPETLERTTLGALRPGDTVNLETDVLARYVERLMERP